MGRPMGEKKGEQKRKARASYMEWAAYEVARRKEQREKPGNLEVECTECGHKRGKHRLGMSNGLLVERCKLLDPDEEKEQDDRVCGCDLFVPMYNVEDDDA